MYETPNPLILYVCKRKKPILIRFLESKKWLNSFEINYNAMTFLMKTYLQVINNLLNSVLVCILRSIGPNITSHLNVLFVYIICNQMPIFLINFQCNQNCIWIVRQMHCTSYAYSVLCCWQSIRTTDTIHNNHRGVH